MRRYTTLKYQIGARIRKYREDRGFTQKKFAELIGVSNARVSNWEQGINRPDADILANICQVLEVSPSELLDVKLPTDELSDHERNVIRAYRKKKELQHSVNLLLEITDEK